MASQGERTQCNDARAYKIQHFRGGIKTSFNPTRNSIKKMDKPKQSTKKYSLSEKNNRLLQAKPNDTDL